MVELRPAAREDVDTLFALDQACFRPGIAYSKAELKYFLFHPSGNALVAEDAGSIEGFAIAETRMSHGKRVGHIVTIDVSPARRRRGVGRLLMIAVTERCREAGASRMQLEVAVNNEGAIAFYTELGFRPTGRIRGYYMGKLDAVVMEQELAQRLI